MGGGLEQKAGGSLDFEPLERCGLGYFDLQLTQRRCVKSCAV